MALHPCHTALAVAALAFVCPSTATGQSLLDRPPNMSGGWVVAPGVVQFNFLHRFSRSDAPERKITGFPTFTIGAGVYERLMLGFHYATNSQLTPQYPNEWEFFTRYTPISEETGGSFDLAGQLGYNLSAEGLDGEVTIGRTFGRARLLAATRILSSPDESGEVDVALAGGATVRLLPWLALAGDVGSVLDRDEARGEEVAWGAGIHLAIPNTPHTLSLQATNTITTTLQGVSRGTDDVRYGFEFTIPFTLARYFGGRASPAETTPSAETPATDSLTLKNFRFAPQRIEITAGSTILWRNDDPVAHTVTADDGSFDSGVIEAGQSWSRTFTTPGTYTYHCTPHPFMRGTVVVR